MAKRETDSLFTTSICKYNNVYRMLNAFCIDVSILDTVVCTGKGTNSGLFVFLVATGRPVLGHAVTTGCISCYSPARLSEEETEKNVVVQNGA